MYDKGFHVKKFRNWLYYFRFTQKQHEKAQNIRNIKKHKKFINEILHIAVHTR